MSSKEAFDGLLKRKDKEIEELQKRNELLIKVAIKRSRALHEMMQRLEELRNENEKLKAERKERLKNKERVKRKKEEKA